MSKSKSKNRIKRDAYTLFGFTLDTRKASMIIFGFAFLLYANTLGHDYVQDDAIVITQNFLTQQGVSGIPELLSTDTFYGFFKTEGKSRLVAGGRYRPLTPVMFALEYQLFGLKPWIGHLVNVLFYGLTGVLVFFMLMWIGQFVPWLRDVMPFALLGGLLFVAHPIHTEVVANIKGRDEMMSFLLSLSALFITVRQLPSAGPGIPGNIAAGVLFFLALLSKENAITFLAIVPLTMWYFSRSKVRSIVLSLVPYIVAAAVFLIIRGQIIGWALGEPPRELLNNPFLKIVDGTYVDFTFSEKMATISFTLGKYLQLLFWPFPQTHDYYPRHIDLMHWTDWKVILSVMAYLGLTVAAFIGLRGRRIWSYAIFYYLITLSIVSNIVFPVGTNMSERFLYMPSLGWVIGIAALFTWLMRKSWKTYGALSGIVVLLFSGLTVMRNRVWKDNYTLFTTDIKTAPNSVKLLAAAAGAIMTDREKFPEGPLRDKKIREAVDYLTRAQEMHPNYKLSYLLRGNAHYYLGEYDQAIQGYRQVLAWSPDDQEARNNLGIAYREAGRFYGEQQGEIPTAIVYLSEAVKYIPEDYEAVHSLGVAYGMNGQPMLALEMFRRGVEISPENPTAHFNLGLAYQQTGDLDNAQKHRDIALQLDPDILNRRSQQSEQ